VLVAIDSGSEYASVAVAVAVGDESSLSKVTLREVRNSEYLLSALDSLVRRRGLSLLDIKKVVVAIGPGSYTGLRVGLALSQGLAAGAGASLLGMSSLVAGIFSEGLLEKRTPGSVILESMIRLRENEFARCLFSFTEGVLRQQSSIELVQDRLLTEPAIDAETYLRAAMAICNYMPFQEGIPLFKECSAFAPLELLYGKPVQAKTLVERGIN